MSEKKIRVLIAKPGLDGHDRGAKIIARALRDAGMEVIYTGLRQTPEMIASAAVQEDVDVIGLSILSGAHSTLAPRLMELLKQKGMNDVTVLLGGTIPEADIPALKKAGIAEIFLPGTSTQDIVNFVREHARRVEYTEACDFSNPSIIQNPQAEACSTKFYFTTFPSASRISIAPKSNFTSSGSIFARSPTQIRIIWSGCRYFFATDSASSAVTAFKRSGNFSK